MEKLKLYSDSINKFSIDGLLSIIGKIDLEQITDESILYNWFDGDWGEYWYLFKTKDDNMRVEFVDGHNNGCTYIKICHCEKITPQGKKIYGGKLSLSFTISHLSQSQIIELIESFGLKFTNKEFKFSDWTLKK